MFNRENLVYGLSDPRIKEGVKGWFSESVMEIKAAVEAGNREICLYGEILHGQPKEGPYLRVFNVSSIGPPKIDEYTFFYIDDNNYRALNVHEIIELVKKQTKIYRKVDAYGKKAGEEYIMKSVKVSEKNIHIDIGDTSYHNSASIRRWFVFEDGSPIEVRIEPSEA